MMVAALVIVFAVAFAIIEYNDTTTVNLQITASPHAYFVVTGGGQNVTVPKDQSAGVQIPPDTNVTVFAYPDTSYSVAGWSVSPVSVTPVGPNAVQFITGKGGSTITLSVTLSNGTSSTPSPDLRSGR